MKNSIEWKDATDYAQGQRGKIEPNAFECKVGGVRVRLTRAHVHHPGKWVVSFIQNVKPICSSEMSEENAKVLALEKAKALATSNAEHWAAVSRELSIACGHN